jgi:fermentation-respiration switch protein FrsA (DUF1100 family)
MLFFPPLLGSCTRLFYYPSNETIVNPSDLGYSYGDIYFKSRDGTKLHGWLFPSSNEKEELGTVIQFHGNAENISSHFLSLAWVTRYGYNFFTFDYRGYGGSEGSPCPKGTNDDALAALDYVIKLNEKREGMVKKNSVDRGHKIIAYGQSLGGAVLLRAFDEFEQKKKIDAVVVDSAFYSYHKIAKDAFSGSLISWPIKAMVPLLINNDFSPETCIGKISPTPLLIIHGDGDLVVPYSHGKKIYELAKEPKTFWTIPRGRHIDSMVDHDEKYQKKLIEFIGSL